MAFSEEILFRNICVKKKSIAATISTAHLKCPRGTLFDVNQEVDGIRLIRFLCGDLHVLEIAGSLQRIAALGNLRARKKLLFVHEQFATDDFVACFRVASDQHTIKIHRRSFADHQRHVDALCVRVYLSYRIHLSKRKALVRVHIRERRHVLAQTATSKDLAGGELDRFEHLLPVGDQFPAQFNFADAILRPFTDAENHF